MGIKDYNIKSMSLACICSPFISLFAAMKSLCSGTAIEDGERSLGESLIDDGGQERDNEEVKTMSSGGAMLSKVSEYNSDDNFVPVDEPLYSDPCWWAALKKEDDNDLSWLASSSTTMLDASSTSMPPPQPSSAVPISTLLSEDNAITDSTNRIPTTGTSAIDDSILNV